MSPCYGNGIQGFLVSNFAITGNTFDQIGFGSAGNYDTINLSNWGPHEITGNVFQDASNTVRHFFNNSAETHASTFSGNTLSTGQGSSFATLVVSQANDIIGPNSVSNSGGVVVGTDVYQNMIQNASVTFANLGTPANGTQVYCSNCTIANPCAGGGTGAFAKRITATWICN